MLRTLPFILAISTTLFFAHTAEAASLFFTPGTGEFGIGKEIPVDIKINSDGVGINAAQATIRFPKDILTVKSIDKTGSTFNFWLEEPTFSNEEGAISFVGGTPYGISGASIQVLHIVFIARTAGLAPVSIADSAVTASDGSGANVVSKTADAAFTIVPSVAAPVITPPTQIKRAPVPATGLPIKPTIKVPSYSDPDEWYNHSSPFTVTWELPLDISGVATAVNQRPNFAPEKSEGLFDSKMFPPTPNGIWYLHVRFKNTKGWGPTTHQRIAIDTQPPAPFGVTTQEALASDNPTPTFLFKTSDALSSIHEYHAKIDNADWTTIPTKDFDGSYQLPHQNPGKHHLIIQAHDNADNSIESSIDFETLALPSPTFTFVTDKLFSNEVRGLSLKGTAIPSSEILLSIKADDTIDSELPPIPVNARGQWEYTFTKPLHNGHYIAMIKNRDSRGATSLTVNSSEIIVTDRYTNLILLVFGILIILFIASYWFFKKRMARTALRIELAESDATKVFKMFETDIQKLQDAQKTSTTADDEFLTEKLKKNVTKMGAYIKEEISKAKK